MAQHETLDRDQLLAAILSEEAFRPAEPTSIQDAGVPIALIESLLLKRLLVSGASTGRKLAEQVCLPFRILEETFQSLRSRQIVVHQGAAPLNDYVYSLTEQGRSTAQMAMNACGYLGAVPVPLMDYVLATEAQTIRVESPRRSQLREAFADISIDEDLFDSLGPAINSGAGLFLYGEPGNGKSTLAKRVTMCFGQRIWVPHALIEDGQIIKLYDAALHSADESEGNSIIRSAAYDRRWVKVRRPTVVVGGELTMENLEIRHDPHSNVSEAPLQLKSNCGCLLIDDFGRQRIEPHELLNRWIVPLESRVDYLTLSTGKKIAVPFEQLIIFSTNIEPSDLVDEAFLRRIPYKIEVTDPSEEEFFRLFELYANAFDCDYRPEVVQYLLETHYRPAGRRLRRCHPRDLLSQIKNYCRYHDIPMAMETEYLDHVVKSYFTIVCGKMRRPVKSTKTEVATCETP
jgi:predicted ATPase with chaperone activity